MALPRAGWETAKYRICLIGDSGCGKTEVFERFMHGRPVKTQRSTDATSYAEKSVPMAGTGTAKIMMWDTPGKALDRNVAVGPANMSMLIFFYDPSVKESFLNVPKWLQAGTAKSEKCQLALISVKEDLVNNGSIDALVSSEDAAKMSSSRGMKFYTLNATDTNAVNECMRSLISEVAASSGGRQIDWDAEESSATATKKGHTVEKVKSSKKCGCL